MQTVKVRLTSAQGILKEEGKDEETGEEYDIHITGYDENGFPVMPIYEVPLTARVSHAIHKEKRLVDVTGGEKKAQADVERLRVKHLAEQSKTSPAQAFLTLTAAELELRLEAARNEGAKAGLAGKKKAVEGE